ncbi:hypothetical protein K2173_011993 [Erythroxylum novogranatense]|uniref:Uncharacterized protein n=1 Tax=Erythroxylum novogranatense TaxID=1862640 RepID=A0AAV8TEI2_9ROSI|nr:hypothetical protein K2173_011993 [Erythroxylum novogranatense]
MKEKVGHMKLLRDQAVSLYLGMAKEIKLTRSQQIIRFINMKEGQRFKMLPKFFVHNPRTISLN